MSEHTDDHPLGSPGGHRQTGAVTVDRDAAARAANRFDIRRIIGALFCLYAAILIVTGLTGSHQVRTKAAGINIDLYTGAAMAIVGALMIVWSVSRPVEPELGDAPAAD